VSNWETCSFLSNQLAANGFYIFSSAQSSYHVIHGCQSISLKPLSTAFCKKILSEFYEFRKLLKFEHKMSRHRRAPIGRNVPMPF
jgi:hypothetical protein